MFLSVCFITFFEVFLTLQFLYKMLSSFLSMTPFWMMLETVWYFSPYTRKENICHIIHIIVIVALLSRATIHICKLWDKTLSPLSQPPHAKHFPPAITPLPTCHYTRIYFYMYSVVQCQKVKIFIPDKIAKFVWHPAVQFSILIFFVNQCKKN